MARILLADDDFALAEMIRENLERSQYLADAVRDGTEALDCLKTYSYDLLILDWEMPNLSGIDLLRAYRAEGGKIPVLMLTGKSSLDNKDEGFDCGADDYLTKPFEMRELLMRVRALLRRPLPIAQSTIQAGDLLLDTDKAVITLMGEEISLTRREFLLLEFLMRHKGQIFNAEALLDRVWSMEADASVDAIRQCVIRLRKKIERPGKNSMIQNVYGLGYKFQAD
ncbi:MAG: response regulator transcription factor [Candidatus Obscuribacterales bacterium]|nr:response regulator transcription factor [Candidatus Obscuribacterales bacterium]